MEKEMRSLSYKEAMCAMTGYKHVKGWKVVINTKKEINYYTIEAIDEDGTLRAFVMVSKKTAEKIKKEWKL